MPLKPPDIFITGHRDDGVDLRRVHDRVQALLKENGLGPVLFPFSFQLHPPALPLHMLLDTDATFVVRKKEPKRGKKRQRVPDFIIECTNKTRKKDWR